MKPAVLSNETAKMDITCKRLQKLVSSYEMAINIKQNKEIKLWSKVQSMSLYTTEPIDRFDCALFKYITVYNYTRTSKQKFPFVLEAKEGYLSTPTMSYSCMDIL